MTIEVFAAFQGVNEEDFSFIIYDGKYNQFRLEFIPEDENEDFSHRYQQRHYVEMSREEATILVQELMKQLEYLRPT